jgi:hypothetical protein
MPILLISRGYEQPLPLYFEAQSKVRGGDLDAVVLRIAQQMLRAQQV